MGQRVQEIRESRGLLQRDLADMAKVHATYISRLEAGALNPSLDHVVDIAYALGVNPARLTGNLLPRDLRGRRRAVPSDTDEPAS
jgi:XRE family transcriptional regulator, regulator of sulfur utilization